MKKTADALVRSLVTSRLDYCNSLLCGVPQKSHNELQRVPNTAAKVIHGLCKYDHVTPVLKALHWLPVYKRVEFKVLCMTFKALKGLAPRYLRDLLHYYEPTRPLCSEGKNLLLVPKTRLKTFGDRAFSVQAPRLWNKLPIEIRTAPSLDVFKKMLKTHLFTQHYTE